MKNLFLPMSQKELKEAEIDQLDFVYVIGDAYVDHPSFGPAIISRLLESHGYRVGIISQPDWKDDASIAVLGRPRLAFLVSAGNMDSMVNHYTVSRKHRQKDAYTPGGVMGRRPDRACIVYSNLIRRVFKDVPVILGGIEASLRRLAHYDYWDDKVRRSILMDCGADLISYGMGEHSIVEIADALDSGLEVRDLTFIAGTAYRSKDVSAVRDGIFLPDYDTICADARAYADSCRVQYQNTDSHTAKPLIESYAAQGYVVQNPPAKPLTTMEMDDIYALPYQRTWHPSYDRLGGIPAFEEIKFSLTSNRGCFGGCNFCALTFHQGRTVQVRSHESILAEAKACTEDKDFKGYIHDVGGPTADFRHPSCKKQLEKGVCSTKQCLFPKPCPNLDADHGDYLELLHKLREVSGVKKVFIRSGIRFDYVLADKETDFLKELVAYHVSGQLRVAPEHVSDAVLRCMGKPAHSVYERFVKKFREETQAIGKKQYAVPYFMSSHPGCTMKDAVALAEYIRDMGFMPEQVQDFYPTPSTVSTCMYYTGIHPLTGESVYVPRNPHEKAIQRALIQYRNPSNEALVREGLALAGREDLIGFDRKCLIRPRKGETVKTVSREKEGRKKKKTIRNVHKKKNRK